MPTKQPVTTEKRAAKQELGRPTLLTPERQEIIIETLRGGGYAEAAIKRAGIGHSTYYEWLQKGEAGDQPYADFADAVKKAEADAETRAVATVLAVAFGAPAQYDAQGNQIREEEKRNWQAAMTYLERRYADRWGRRVSEQKHEVSGPDGGPVQIAYEHLSAEELAAIAAGGAGDPGEASGEAGEG